jgi:hypothetical protein
MWLKTITFRNARAPIVGPTQKKAKAARTVELACRCAFIPVPISGPILRTADSSQSMGLSDVVRCMRV